MSVSFLSLLFNRPLAKRSLSSFMDDMQNVVSYFGEYRDLSSNFNFRPLENPNKEAQQPGVLVGALRKAYENPQMNEYFQKVPEHFAVDADIGRNDYYLGRLFVITQPSIPVDDYPHLGQLMSENKLLRHYLELEPQVTMNYLKEMALVSTDKRGLLEALDKPKNGFLSGIMSRTSSASNAMFFVNLLRKTSNADEIEKKFTFSDAWGEARRGRGFDDAFIEFKDMYNKTDEGEQLIPQRDSKMRDKQDATFAAPHR